jgi:hypothetical protein
MAAKGSSSIEPDSQSQVEAAALERVRSLISDETVTNWEPKRWS